jgi:hypothetical protein
VACKRMSDQGELLQSGRSMKSAVRAEGLRETDDSWSRPDRGGPAETTRAFLLDFLGGWREVIRVCTVDGDCARSASRAGRSSRSVSTRPS